MDNSEAEDLRQALEDLHALQRESDHRVKNNLQLVSSLLQLQGRRAADPAVREALKSIQQRMSALSAAHRHVSRDEGREWVQADGMVRDVVGDLAQGAGRDDIVFELRIDPLRIAARDAAPLALITNELVGNAIRHGCPPGPCRVEIEVSRTTQGYRLMVCDDGRDGVPPEDRPGVGMTICQLLVQQVRGALQVAPPGPGRRVILSAPLSDQTTQAAE